MSKDSESEGKAGGLPSSVPEIYFDIIGRVIPGSVAIGLYQFDSLTHTLNTPTVSFALVASYFLGMILDIVGNRLWELLFYAAQPALARHISFFRLYRDAVLWPWIRGTPAQADRNVFTKMMAEKMMFRSTSLVALVAAFFPPPIIYHHYTGPAWHIAIPAFLLLTYSMLEMHKWISWDKDNYNERLKKNSTVA